MKTTKCPKCKGTGRAPLPPRLSAALEALPPKPATIRVGDIARSLGIKETAAYMRLERLREMKLVTRRPDGHGWLYVRK